MINPSINGWIDKFLASEYDNISSKVTDDLFYKNLRSKGFLFGNVISDDKKNNLLQSELLKVAYLEALCGVFILNNEKKSDFIEKCNLFFFNLNPSQNSILEKILPKSSNSLNLENNIGNRIYLNENVFTKNFSHIVTNAFLFIDILAFQQFIINSKIPKSYLKKVEETIISIVTLSLKTKLKKSKHDDLLIKLFENSTRYSKFSLTKSKTIETLDLEFLTNILEKKYLIDIASLTLWSDGELENNEIYFLQKLTQILHLPENFAKESLLLTNQFIIENKEHLYYFSELNPIKSFYDATTNNVKKLIIRNKKRLVKEIVQSKELMQLLAISTTRNLDEIEKKKIKKQLLDICKSIPSLTIFLIPGGSLLLPLLIKFIPQMLPSSFNENLEDD